MFLFSFFKSLLFPKATDLRVVSSRPYGLSKEEIPFHVLTILETLREHRYVAFIVGGAVRDLLLKRHPKDFDIATNAHPEEITNLFRRSRVIGRRFRIVHIYSGRDCVEVTTFRGGAISDQPTDSFGRVIEDNCYGAQHEDAVRRDFSVNALYYDPLSGRIFDYVRGIEDVFSGVVRTIGKPDERFREDPVRILRAIRFSEKLSFSLEPALVKEISRQALLLAHVPSARLFDELVKILVSGHASACLNRLSQYGVTDAISFLSLIRSCMDDPFVCKALQKTDQRVQNTQSVSTMFLFASFFWPFVRARWKKEESPRSSYLSLLRAAEEVGELVHRQYALPKRIAFSAKEIWSMQARFDYFSANRAVRLLKHPRFRLAYDFMLLRCEAHELTPSTGAWWRKFLSAHPQK